MFRRLVVATDGEDGLERLGSCLSQLQHSGIEQVTFVHATTWTDDGLGIPETTHPQVTQMEQRLWGAIQEPPPGMRVGVKVLFGKPVDVILRGVAETQADLVILAMSMQGFLAEKVFGSTTINLLPRLGIPALIIRPALLGALTLAELRSRCAHLFEYLLLPYDFGANAAKVLEKIASSLEAHPHPSCRHLSLLYVLDTTSRLGQMAASEQFSRCEQQLQAVAQTYQQRLPGIQITARVRQGSPLTEILREAGATDVTAIALGSRKPGGLMEWSVPSLSGEILRKSWHSILFIPL
ncbi:MAG: universal stress protein [Thermostichales cyanobacterium GMQP_bins_62]